MVASHYTQKPQSGRLGPAGTSPHCSHIVANQPLTPYLTAFPLSVIVIGKGIDTKNMAIQTSTHTARRLLGVYGLFGLQLALFIGAFSLLGIRLLQGTKAATPQNVSVDFTQTVTAVNPLAFGMDETGYQSPNVLGNDAKEQQVFRALHLGYMRMDLVYAASGNPASGLVCGGSGCDTGITGDQWIGAIKGTGAQPVVIVYTKSPTDATNAVKHFNVNPNTGKADASLPNYVKYWIVGNEPDLNGYSATSYGGYFNTDYDAMKAVDPSIKIGGPTKAWYDHTWIQQFLQISGSRVDFLDFHGYPQSGQQNGDIPTLFKWAAGTGKDIADLRSLMQSMQPARTSQVPIEVGEWALDSGGSAQTHTNFNAVWAADVLGNILANGGISLFYGTKGNAIEWSPTYTVTDDFGRNITLKLDDPEAPYHGIGMFTGESLFRGFGTSVVKSSTTLPNVDVFASNNAKNIVVINKDQALSQTGVFSLNGAASGTVDVWQKNQNLPFNVPPAHVGTVSFQNSTFTYALPAMSATTFVVNSSGAAQSPSPAPTASPSPTAKPAVTLTVNPVAVSAGGTSKLTWSSTNASACSASNGWSGTESLSGSLTTPPIQTTTTYVLTCTGRGGSATASVTVTVHGLKTTSPSPTTLPEVSGTLTLGSDAANGQTVTYTIDGRPVTGEINTKNLADGKHTVVATITRPDGTTTTERSTITVNNHNPFWKNVYLRYGLTKTAGGSAAILAVLYVGVWYLVLRFRTLRTHRRAIIADPADSVSIAEQPAPTIITPNAGSHTDEPTDPQRSGHLPIS
jgi:hypothetical protein